MTQKTKDSIPVQRLLVPGYILTISELLTKLSPFLASRFAAKLFLTPFRYKLPEREKEMDRNSIQQKVNVPGIDQEIVTYSYGNSKKKILLVHGWSGRGTQLTRIAGELKHMGFQTISFDAPGHGKAAGKMSMMPYFIEAIKYLDQKHGPFEGIVAHSLGGMSSLRAIKDGLKTKKLVLIGTANNVTEITRNFAANMKMNDKVAEKMKAYLDHKFDQDLDTLSGAVSARDVKTPTLIIHDEEDVDVQVHSAYEIDAVLENSELMITRKLGHRRILGDPEVINKITGFIAAQ